MQPDRESPRATQEGLFARYCWAKPAAWVIAAHLHGVQGVAGSNPVAPIRAYEETRKPLFVPGARLVPISLGSSGMSALYVDRAGNAACSSVMNYSAASWTVGPAIGTGMLVWRLGYTSRGTTIPKRRGAGVTSEHDEKRLESALLRATPGSSPDRQFCARGRARDNMLADRFAVDQAA